MMKNIVLILLLVALVKKEVNAKKNVKEEFEKYQIVPDVVSVAPNRMVQVEFPSGVKANLGNMLTIAETKDQPTVTTHYSKSKYYTMAMVDPDVPSRATPVNRNLVHWLRVNITEDDSGIDLAEYIAPAPPKCTGPHRYTILIYQQSRGMEFQETYTTTESRKNFSISAFAKKYKLGNPIAGNFFLTQYNKNTFCILQCNC